MNREIKKIYNEYFNLLSEYLTNEREKLDADGLVELAINGSVPKEWLEQQILKRGFYLDSMSQERLFIESELKRAHESCLMFWKKNANVFLEKIINENHNSVAITRNNIKKFEKLPLYFDSLLIIDPFHISTANSEFDKLHQNKTKAQYLERWDRALADFLVTYYLLESILEIDLDNPVYLLCPEQKMIKSSRLKQLEKEALELSEINMNYFRHELGVEFNHMQEFTNKILHLSDTEAESYLIKLHKSGGREKIKRSNTHEEQVGAYDMVSFVPNPVKRELLALSLMNNTRFGRVLDVQNCANLYEVLSGTTENDWDTMHDSYKINQNHLFNAVSVNKDHLILRTIEKDSIKVLNNLSYLEMVAIREDGYLSETRDLLRQSNKSISLAQIQDFDRVVDKVEEDFNKALKEASDKIEKDKLLLVRKYNKSVASFVSSATISILTSKVPLLGQLSSVVSFGSLVVGSSSFIDVINNHVTKKKKIKEFSQRPISILMRDQKT